MEVRYLSLTNEGRGVREIELTSILGSGFKPSRGPIRRIRALSKMFVYKPNLSPSAARC